jgi:hypothetical protein
VNDLAEYLYNENIHEILTLCDELGVSLTFRPEVDGIYQIAVIRLGKNRKNTLAKSIYISNEELGGAMGHRLITYIRDIIAEFDDIDAEHEEENKNDQT